MATKRLDRMENEIEYLGEQIAEMRRALIAMADTITEQFSKSFGSDWKTVSKWREEYDGTVSTSQYRKLAEVTDDIRRGVSLDAILDGRKLRSNKAFVARLYEYAEWLTRNADD